MDHRAALRKQHWTDINYEKSAKQRHEEAFIERSLMLLILFGLWLCGFLRFCVFNCPDLNSGNIKKKTIQGGRTPVFIPVPWAKAAGSNIPTTLRSLWRKLSKFFTCESISTNWISVSNRKQSAFFTFVTWKNLAKLLNYGKSWIWQIPNIVKLSSPSPSCSKGIRSCWKGGREDQNWSISTRFQNIFPIAREATKQANWPKFNKVKIDSLKHGMC